MHTIHLYFHHHQYNYNWSYNELYPETWGHIASLFYRSLQRVPSLDLSGSKIIGIYEPSENIVLTMDEIIYFPSFEFQRLLSWEEIERNKNKKYYLLLEGPIHQLIKTIYTSLFYSIVLQYLLGVTPPELSPPLRYTGLMKIGLRDLKHLLQCSSTTKRILSNNRFWDQFEYPGSREAIPILASHIKLWIRWESFGSAGNEDEYWDYYQEENVIPKSVVYKFRWTARHLSKLRLLYGHIPFTTIHRSLSDATSPSPSFWRNILDNVLPFFRSSDVRDQFQHSIQIVNFHRSSASQDQAFMKTFMRKLHYLVPTSATNYHFTNRSNSLTTDLITSSTSSGSVSSPLSPPTSSIANNRSHFGVIQPLFAPYSRLIDLEPSPKDCRGRKSLPDDPCTRVESIRFTNKSGREECSTSQEFIYRRIGDRRITFLQYDYSLQALATNERSFYHFSQSSLTARSASSSTSFLSLNKSEKAFPSITTTLWNLLSEKTFGYILYLQYDSPASFQLQKRYLQEFCEIFLFGNYRCYQSNPFPAPLLILVGIPWQGFVLSLIEDIELQQLLQGTSDLTAIDEKVQEELTKILKETSHWFRLLFQCYAPNYCLHAINIQTEEREMQQGYLNSLNWLFREIIRKVTIQYA